MASSSQVTIKGSAMVWTCGTFIFIQLPLITFKFYWRTQLLFMKLPFLCGYRLFLVFQRLLCRLLRIEKHGNTSTKITYFFKRNLEEKHEIVESMKDMRRHSILAISKVNILSNYVGTSYGKSEHSNCVYDLASEEMKLFGVVVNAARNLELLKNFRELNNETNSEEDLASILSHFSVQDCASDSIEGDLADVNSVLKEGYIKLQEQTEQMRVAVERRKLLNGVDNDNYCEQLQAKTNCTPNMVRLGMGTLETIINLMSIENSQLKKRLKSTIDQVEELKRTSVCLKDTISNLELQLEEVRGFLHSAQSDRSEMQDKLLILEGMIEEEEVFLNDDTSSDDSYCELYVTPKEFNADLVGHSTPNETSAVFHFHNEYFEDNNI